MQGCYAAFLKPNDLETGSTLEPAFGRLLQHFSSQEVTSADMLVRSMLFPAHSSPWHAHTLLNACVHQKLLHLEEHLCNSSLAACVKLSKEGGVFLQPVLLV